MSIRHDVHKNKSHLVKATVDSRGARTRSGVFPARERASVAVLAKSLAQQI